MTQLCPLHQRVTIGFDGISAKLPPSNLASAIYPSPQLLVEHFSLNIEVNICNEGKAYVSRMALSILGMPNSGSKSMAELKLSIASRRSPLLIAFAPRIS